MVKWHHTALGCALLLAAACRPEIDGRPSLVDGQRVLALRSEPAEGKPQAAVTYDSLFVSLTGTLDGSELDWALCQQRKALTESGTIAHACLAPESDVLQPLGVGPSVAGSILKDACALFGPTPPTPKPGERSVRAVDPDTTGGYYQAVRVLSHELQDEYSVGVTRLGCGLGGATQEQSAAFTKSYRPNENPALDSLVLRHDDGREQTLPAADSEQVVSIARGERVQLTAAWQNCPLAGVCGDGICGMDEDSSAASCPDDCTTPHGCTGSEPYVYFDPQNRALTDRREAVRVSWFANAGHFDHERTGRAESDASSNTSDNPWTAPDDSLDVWLWVVIRDDRGGTGWSSYRLRAE
jgi:hypothetical protein